ncbi:MAG: hypothetical protein M0Z70_11015, partial [Nitrospiraceae bacterium]|nr:hypothetical protein [Nitrospiraceae bacterium]
MINRDNIRFKIIVPIFIFIIVIMLSLLFVVQKVSKDITEDYHSFVISKYSSEIQKILDTAITELTISQLFDNKIVVDAKKKVVTDEIAYYLSANAIDGFITTSKGEILFSSLDGTSTKSLLSLTTRKGNFHIEKGIKHRHGYVIDFPTWDWKIVAVTKPETPLVYKSGIVL